MVVSTKVISEDNFFDPSNQSKIKTIELYIFSPDKDIVLRHFGTNTVYCGFKIQVSPGYRVSFCINSYWSEKGIVINGPNYLDCQEQISFNINILNLSEKIVILKNKDRIGKMWLEPVYTFDFN
jgi:dUTPase